MRTLDIDFHRAPHPSVLGWILLAAGLTVAAGLATMHHAVNIETARHQTTLRSIETRLAKVTQPETGTASDDTTLAAAQQVLASAERPWNSLLTALEAADDKDTAVLSITPDTVRSQVRIHAEARHLAAMLAYQQRLQAENGLRQVTLIDHEMVRDSAEAPVRFHINASWDSNRSGGNRAAP